MLLILSGQKYIHVEEEIAEVRLAHLVTGQCLPERMLGFMFTALLGEEFDSNVRDAAPHVGKEAESGGKHFLQIFQGMDRDAGGFSEALDIFRIIICPEGKSLVGSEGRSDLHREGCIFTDLLMPFQRIGRIIGGRNDLHVAGNDQFPGRHAGVTDKLVGTVKDLIGVISRQRIFDLEILRKLHMGPNIERASRCHLQCFRIGTEFFPVEFFLVLRFFRFCSDEFFRNTESPHHAPFVVIASQPDIRDGAEFLVFIDLPGRQMTVVIDDRQFTCLFIQCFGCFISQQNVLFHRILLFFFSLYIDEHELSFFYRLIRIVRPMILSRRYTSRREGSSLSKARIRGIYSSS